MNSAFASVRQHPAPDLWPEIERRTDRQLPTPHSPGRQRLLAALVALVVTAGAIIGLWLGFRPGARQAATPTIRVVGQPFDLEAGEGWLWLLTCTKCSDTAVTTGMAEGNLVRIDPKSGRPVAATSVRNPGALAVGEGGLWIANFGTDTVTRLDPRTLRVAATIRLAVKDAVDAGGDRRFLPLYIHTGMGAVWVDTARGALARIDPLTNRVAGYTTLPVETTGDFAVGEGDVWVTEELFGVYRVNAATGQVTARIAIGPRLRRLAVGGSVAVGNVGGAERVAVGGGWSTGTAYPDGHVEYGPTQGDGVAFIDPATGRVVATSPVTDWSGALAFLEGAFWVIRKNGTVLSRLEVPGPALPPGRGVIDVAIGPPPHFFAGGNVWTLKRDGSLVRVPLPSP